MDPLDLLMKKRIYVGNLPYDVTEDEIRNKFNKFGNVIQIELKHRSDTSFDVGLPCFAFLDLKISTNREDACFKTLSQKPWRGHVIKLEHAKESLMSRLEKERAQNKAMEVTSTTPAVIQDKMVQPQRSTDLHLPAKPTSNHLKSSAKLSNGQKGIAKESRVNKTKEPPTKKLEDLHNKLVSEEKRLNSLVEKKMLFLGQKEAIKFALSSVDKPRLNNRVVFNDDQDTGTQTLTTTGAHSSRVKPNLFDDNDEDEVAQKVQFQIKKQFEGKKGQKLLELQSHYASDQRFSLDERFYESDDGKEEEPIQDEYTRQMEILQSIVGQELPTRAEKKDPRATDNFMLRFDPTMADHNKYEIKTRQESLPSNEKPLKRKKRAETKATSQPPASTVNSTEKFYKVSDNLKESLKSTESSGFSLLKMFGSDPKKSNDESDKIDDIKNTKIPRYQQDWTTNPFKYDSSESEDEHDVADVTTIEEVQQPGTWRERFFFKRDDIRLSEGLEFFSVKSSSAEGFDQRRHELKQIVQAKVKHNLRKSQPKKQKLGGSRFTKRFKK